MGDEKEETKSKIQQITSQPETIEVGGVEFEIHPLTNHEFLTQISGGRGRGERDQQEVMLNVITTVLQKDDPSITEEDVKNAPMELTVEVIEALEQVNGLEDFFEKARKQTQKKQR